MTVVRHAGIFEAPTDKLQLHVYARALHQHHRPPRACCSYCKYMSTLLHADAQEQADAALEDDLEQLRELLGIPADPSLDTSADDEDDAPDPGSRHELQRLQANFNSPVSAGSDYTVLQVCTEACCFLKSTSAFCQSLNNLDSGVCQQ